MSFADERRAVEGRFINLLHTTSSVYVSSLDVAIDSAEASIRRTVGSFVADGVKIGGFIRLSGLSNIGNNDAFEVVHVSPLEVLVKDPKAQLISETAQVSYSYPSYRVGFENQDFEPPEPDKIYLTLFIIAGDGYQISCGNTPWFRFIGIIQVSVYAPNGFGTQEAKELADRVAGFFRNAQFSDAASGLITCGTPTTAALDYRTYSRLGSRDTRYRLDVSTPFHRDIQY